MYDTTANTTNIREIIPEWLNISELSRRCGVTRPTIYKYFRGEAIIQPCRVLIEKEVRAMEEETRQPAPAA